MTDATLSVKVMVMGTDHRARLSSLAALLRINQSRRSKATDTLGRRGGSAHAAAAAAAAAATPAAVWWLWCVVSLYAGAQPMGAGWRRRETARRHDGRASAAGVVSGCCWGCEWLTCEWLSSGGRLELLGAPRDNGCSALERALKRQNCLQLAPRLSWCMARITHRRTFQQPSPPARYSTNNSARTRAKQKRPTKNAGAGTEAAGRQLPLQRARMEDPGVGGWGAGWGVARSERRSHATAARAHTDMHRNRTQRSIAHACLPLSLPLCPVSLQLSATHSYTGFSPSMQETYKKTPFMAQLEAKAPTPDSFVHTRKHTGPKSTYHSLQRDACNHPEELGHKHSEDSLNLFPCLQERAAQVGVCWVCAAGMWRVRAGNAERSGSSAGCSAAC